MELQTEEMSVHSVGPLGLHPNNFLKQKVIIVFLELGVELQTEEMSVHSVGPLGLHPNNFLSPCKQCMILRSVQLWHGALLILYVSF